MTIKADLRHVIYALSNSLDLVGVDDVGHGKRVGIMAAECGKTQGLPGSRVSFLFDLGLIHDIGVSSTEAHRHLVSEFDWQGSQEHCIRGHALLSEFAPLATMALPIMYHHTRWDRLVESGVDPEIAWQANLTLLVDRVDAFMAPRYGNSSVLMHTDKVREQIRLRAGTYFAPRLVELFLDASRAESFWLLLEPRSIELYLQDLLSVGLEYEASAEDLRRLALVFARIVDAKSIFTAEHSMGVAGVARLLAEKMGVSTENCGKIEIAGFLHDLGKLRVPDEILDKPLGLDARERRIINAHAFETYQILRHIKGFEEIAQWAAYHHEEPGGCGYPFHLKGEALALEARIMRVADIFQAMAQDRPYRKGLSGDEVQLFMRQLADEGRVDAGIIEVLNLNIGAALVAARRAIPSKRHRPRVDCRNPAGRTRKAVTWHLYVIRTSDGSLYAGITTDVRRRYHEHASGGPKAARYLRANPPTELVFKRRIGTRSLALRVEYRFKRLSKRDKEAIVRAGKLRIDRKSGDIRR